MIQSNAQDQPQNENLEMIQNTHPSNQLRDKEHKWRLTLIFYILILFTILTYSILLENSKQIKAPFDQEGKQCGLDEEVMDCPYSMQYNISNKTQNICVKQCPDLNHYTYDCYQNQIRTTIQLLQVDNICFEEQKFISTFNYFHSNIIYIPVIITTCAVSFLISLLLFHYLLVRHIGIRFLSLCIVTIFDFGCILWAILGPKNYIQSQQLQIMIYFLLICYFCFQIYMMRFIINLFIQFLTFMRLSICIYEFYMLFRNFRLTLIIQSLTSTLILLLTYITLSYVSYLGHAIINPDYQISGIEYNYYQYIYIVICFNILQFYIYFILGFGKTCVGFEICQAYYNQTKSNFKDILLQIYQIHLGSIALSALIQSFTQIPLYILQWIEYLLNLLQLWFDENLRISLRGIISSFRYCDDRQYLILALKRLSIRESSNLLASIKKEYKLDKFSNPHTYNLLIQLYDIALVGLITFGIILTILFTFNIKLYAQYILFFWYILLCSFIISNATLTYIQYILKSIFLLIIIDGTENAAERAACPKVILEYHIYCELQRKIFDEDEILFKLNNKYVQLRKEQIKQESFNQYSEQLQNQIQEIKTQQESHRQYRDKLDDAYQQIVSVN